MASSTNPGQPTKHTSHDWPAMVADGGRDQHRAVCVWPDGHERFETRSRYEAAATDTREHRLAVKRRMDDGH